MRLCVSIPALRLQPSVAATHGPFCVPGIGGIAPVDAATPGGFRITTNPDRSRWATSFSAVICAIRSAAWWIRFLPSNGSAKDSAWIRSSVVAGRRLGVSLISQTVATAREQVQNISGCVLCLRLVHSDGRSHHPRMFMVSEADATAIREVFERDGELSAAIELRRRFPGIVDNARARDCARTIAGWTPLPAPDATVTRLGTRKRRQKPA